MELSNRNKSGKFCFCKIDDDFYVQYLSKSEKANINIAHLTPCLPSVRNGDLVTVLGGLAIQTCEIPKIIWKTVLEYGLCSLVHTRLKKEQQHQLLRDLPEDLESWVSHKHFKGKLTWPEAQQRFLDCLRKHAKEQFQINI